MGSGARGWAAEALGRYGEGNVNITHPTWIDRRVAIGPTTVHSRGAFALEPIEAGEIVTIWAHTLLDPHEIPAVHAGELHRRADGRYVWLPGSREDLEGYDPNEECLNHSCDPNVWMQDEVTLSARRDIAPGEELAGDYALWELDAAHVCGFVCRCGAPNCRRTVTGRDWQLAELQRTYAGHWHPAIEEKIAAARWQPARTDTA